MTREEAFKEINETQNYYVDQLINYLLNKNSVPFKEVNFTSATGTGKTNMMALLCNKLSDKFFIITSLSKGQLVDQIRKNLAAYVNQNNYIVWGPVNLNLILI